VRRFDPVLFSLGKFSATRAYCGASRRTHFSTKTSSEVSKLGGELRMSNRPIVARQNLSGLK
jgi:hypothetical protein